MHRSTGAQVLDLKDLMSKKHGLRKTSTNDRSGYIKPGLGEEQIEAYHRDVLDTYVEEWGPLLERQGLTFRTGYISIDRATASFLIKAYEEFEKLDSDNGAKFDIAGSDPEGEGKISDKMNDFDSLFGRLFEEGEEEKKTQDPPGLGRKLLEKLQSRIDECLQDWGCSKVFVKGSSRSAKDSVIFTDKLRSDLGSRIRSLKETRHKEYGDGGTVSVNDAVVAILGAGKDAMASASARYFLRLFVRSERIYQDLTLAMEQSDARIKAQKLKGAEKSDQQDPDLDFVQGFAIREWVDIDIGSEFRGFVYNKRFTACCQYDYLVVMPALQAAEAVEALRRRLADYWRMKVRPALAIQPEEEEEEEAEHPAACQKQKRPPNFSSYVVDFAVDVSGKAWVIELNPFQESTDGAMFSWAREKDLLEGSGLEGTDDGEQQLPVFRVQDKEQNAELMLGKRWRTLLREVL